MSEKITRLQEFIAKEMLGKTTIKVLEAGCGSMSHLRFDQEVYTVGIDISEKQLQRNIKLNERILGDIQHYHFQPSSFDLVVCWDVLEHLPDPDLVLHKFVGSVREKGIIVLKMPNVLSLKGLVTKLLPYPLHILFYKKVHGRQKAGEDDRGPFRTYLRFSIAPTAIKKFAKNNGLRVTYYDTFDASATNWLQRNKMVLIVYKTLNAFIKCVSFGTISDSDFVIVLQKAT